MSIKRNEEITCPACGHHQQMVVWSTVNAMDPDAAQMVRDQRANVFHCKDCGHEAFFDISLLYHDVTQRYCIQYVSRDDMGNPDYYANLSRRGTVVLDPISQRILDGRGETYFNHPHFVFSMREMAAYIMFRDLCAEYGQEVVQKDPAAR